MILFNKENQKLQQIQQQHSENNEEAQNQASIINANLAAVKPALRTFYDHTQVNKKKKKTKIRNESHSNHSNPNL